MLSVCFVSQEYPAETGWGGIGTYTFEMAHGLARAGHRVVVISRALDEPRNYVEADGVEVYRVKPALNLDSTPVLWRLNRYWEGYRLAVALQLRKILAERQIDVIECPELHAETLFHSMLHARPPLVVRLHSGTGVVMNFETDQTATANTDARLERRLLKKATRITSPSMALLSSISMNGDPHRYTVIPNPVDCDHFRPARTAKPKANETTAKVLCVGRPRQIKGIHILAQAMPLVWQADPRVEFTFVPAPMGKGGGSPRDAYAKVLGKLLTDKRVRIAAPASRDELPGLYRDASLCVVPSLWEGFGYVCAEAMACGVPVIASRVGGLAEIIEDGKSGVLVEPGSAEELARVILSLLKDPERCTQIGADARQRVVDKFSSAVVTSQMENVYKQVILEQR